MRPEVKGLMALNDSLERLLRSFRSYYDVRTEDVDPPFDAAAEFHSNEEQYFLSKKLKLSEEDSNEYVYIAVRELLDEPELLILDDAAWAQGCSHIVPGPNHRNSDITLIILAEHVDKAAAAAIPAIHRYKNYRFTFYGWTQYRLAVSELSTGTVITNRQGRSLVQLVSSIQ